MTIRDKLLATCNKRRVAEYNVDGLGEVRLQSLTELERASVEKTANEDTTKLRAMLIAYSMVDEDGNRLFSDEEVGTVLAMDSRFTLPLSTAVLNHLGRDSTEDAVKN
jgi:hypothetical protein